MTPLNILVVDDSMVATQLLKRSLEELGHKVIRTAKSGSEAIEAYAECNPDLVTMDLTMPDMDGIEATRRITHAYADAQVVMVSSHAQSSMVMDALKAGAKGYILKPFKTDRLRAALIRATSRGLKAS
jgi:two-component system chemotaxis response regulator CheY